MPRHSKNTAMSSAQVESATTRAADYVRWRWLRALWWSHLIESAAWWMLLALTLVAFAHSPSVRLGFWLNVVTTLPLCWLSVRWAAVAKPPPLRRWLIVQLCFESLALLTNLAEVVVRAVWLQCKSGETAAAACRVYPERELAIVGLVIVLVLVLTHILAIVFCALVLAELGREVVKQRRDTSRDGQPQRSSSNSKKLSSSSSAAAGTQTPIKALDLL